MRLTRFGFEGALFTLALFGAFYASPYTNLFFLLLAFLTLQWVLAAVGAWRNLRGIQVAWDALAPVPARTSAALPFTVRAPGRARFQLSVELRLASGERLAGRVDLLEEQARVALRVPLLHRGCHAVVGATLGSSHPLGLFLVRRTIEAPSELVVFPAPGAVGEARSAADVLNDALGRDGCERVQPGGLRDRRDEDEPRSIHWRASARRGQLVVQEWDGGGGQGLEVVLDRRCAEAELEEALAILSAIVGLARSGKEVLALHSQGLAAKFGEGQRPWNEALRFLALAEVLPADGPAPPPASPAVTRLPRRMARA